MTKIVVVGEALGQEEELSREPLGGQARQLLDAALIDSNINPDNIFITNVFNERPHSNNISRFFVKKQAARKDNLTSLYTPFGAKGIVHPEKEHHVHKLLSDIKEQDPNVIITLGDTALWAVTGEHKIKNYRGTVLYGNTRHKVVPTYHPVTVLRDYSLRAFFYADIAKASRESAFPEVRTADKKIWLATKTSDLDLFYNLFLMKAPAFAFDVETNYHQREITCISIAPSPDVALVIPFTKDNGTSYWTSPDDELTCLLWLHKLFAEDWRKQIAHNTLYDTTYLIEYGIIPKGSLHDTMLLHHSLEPELPKALGTLASLHTNVPAWKHFRTKTNTEENKKDS